jgi:hypothetical protein
VFALVVVTSVYFGNLAYAEEQRRERLIEAAETRRMADVMTQLQAEGGNARLAQQRSVSHDSAWLFVFTFCAALGVILVEENG